MTIIFSSTRHLSDKNSSASKRVCLNKKVVKSTYIILVCAFCRLCPPLCLEFWLCCKHKSKFAYFKIERPIVIVSSDTLNNLKKHNNVLRLHYNLKSEFIVYEQFDGKPKDENKESKSTWRESCCTFCLLLKKRVLFTIEHSWLISIYFLIRTFFYFNF